MKGLEPSPNATSSWQVLKDSLKKFAAGDLEGSLAHWADDAVVKLIGVLPGEPDTYQGKEQLRAWLKDLSAIHFEIQEELIEVEGDMLTVGALNWSDQTRQLGVAPLEGTEVYVVKNDKITSMTWTITSESQTKLQAALSRG
jgi:ketosteroid isomerase-like protein